MKHNWWKLLVVVIVAAAVVAAVALKNNGREPKLPVSAAKPGQIPRMLELGSDKCGPCKMMKPVIEKLRKEYAGKLEVEFIDVWKDRTAIKRFGVDTIPTQIFFDAGGKEFARHVGYFSKDEIVATFRDHGIDL